MGKCFSKRDVVSPNIPHLDTTDNQQNCIPKQQEKPNPTASENNEQAVSKRKSRNSAFLKALKHRQLQNYQPEQEIPEEVEEEP